MSRVKSLDRLAGCLRRFPGVGPKQAERLALHLLRAPASDIEGLTASLREARERVRACGVCWNYCEEAVCPICADPSRETAVLCVVEEPADVSAIERSRSFRGRYHVLHGALSPLDGIGPESLRIRELLDRIAGAAGSVSEVVIATDPDAEGDATALYLGAALKMHRVRVTRIAMGVPMGGDIDYADERTLQSALAGRRDL